MLGTIPASAMRRNGALTFDFTVDLTVVPEGGNRTLVIPIACLVYRLQNLLSFVAFKMGRLRGVRKEHIWIDM
jgi:hypothetical protein